ncbi:MAG TPA: DNA polymerase III subunit delta' [Alphaproteobacteria bacterium]|jgi:DNA polymerase-3 subunit delta'
MCAAARDPDDQPADSLSGPLAESELVGHAQAEQALLDAWSGGRLHHAWLIAGPEGIGKATLASRFARFLLARGIAGKVSQSAVEEGPSLFGDPTPPAADTAPATSLYIPPTDPVFQRLKSRGHGDLLAITRGYDEKRKRERKVIVIDDVRQVRDFTSLTAAEDGYRVVIIDGAEDMNKSAENALLKVLEEPPKRMVFLLVSHAPGRLLPTTRSRCRLLTLRALADDDVAQLLAKHRPDLAPDEKAMLLRLADGSIGRALRLAEEGGVPLYREMVGLLGKLPDLDISAAHAFSGKLAPPTAVGYDLFGELLGDWIARMVRAGAGGSASEVLPGERELMDRLAGRRGLDQWVEVWEKIAHLFARAAAVNLDRKQVVLSVLLTLQSAARA